MFPIIRRPRLSLVAMCALLVLFLVTLTSGHQFTDYTPVTVSLMLRQPQKPINWKPDTVFDEIPTEWHPKRQDVCIGGYCWMPWPLFHGSYCEPSSPTTFVCYVESFYVKKIDLHQVVCTYRASSKSFEMCQLVYSTVPTPVHTFLDYVCSILSLGSLCLIVFGYFRSDEIIRYFCIVTGIIVYLNVNSYV